MFKVKRVVESEGFPNENDLWLDPKDEVLCLKSKENGEWKPLGKDHVQSDWNQTNNKKADYIKNKPTIPAAQIQADWNQEDSSKKDYIKNKPSIPESFPKRVFVDDITNIPAAVLTSLVAGDVVVKKTGVQRHTYIVSYKGEGVGEGICLSYNAAGYGETVSYDYTNDGWVFNSVDIKTYGEQS